MEVPSIECSIFLCVDQFALLGSHTERERERDRERAQRRLRRLQLKGRLKAKVVSVIRWTTTSLLLLVGNIAKWQTSRSFVSHPISQLKCGKKMRNGSAGP